MKGNIDSIKKFAEQSKFEELDKMIVHGADIAGYRDKDNWNNSLLHIATKESNKELMYFLNQNNVNIDCQNSNGETALHLVTG